MNRAYRRRHELRPIKLIFEPVDFTVGLASEPESWACIDCGVNTAPGFPNRGDVAKAFAEGRSIEAAISDQSELYIVHDTVWSAAGMGDGCLCIGCLETRLGRRLCPVDFPPHAEFNRPDLPCTDRLRQRRDRKSAD